MKVFVVFLGMMLVSITFIAYQGDMAQYLRLQLAMKAAAEEAAAGAALYYDERAYSQGFMVVDEEEAGKYVAYIAERAAADMDLKGQERLEYVMEIHDDEKGYLKEGDSPSVTVTLTLHTEDLFRLSFLEVCRVSRGAEYELEAY
ncbi:MAG: hypothetical protein Q4C22_05820 [Bacillota bacterium]|nr:hypothetical protein [Bacillota bacterium]